MMNETIRQSAEFISKYGNVSTDPERLLEVKPTDIELRKALIQIFNKVNLAFNDIRRYYGMEVDENLFYYELNYGQKTNSKSEKT